MDLLPCLQLLLWHCPSTVHTQQNIEGITPSILKYTMSLTYVWSLKDFKWGHALYLYTIERSAVCCHWKVNIVLKQRPRDDLLVWHIPLNTIDNLQLQDSKINCTTIVDRLKTLSWNEKRKGKGSDALVWRRPLKDRQCTFEATQIGCKNTFDYAKITDRHRTGATKVILQRLCTKGRTFENLEINLYIDTKDQGHSRRRGHKCLLY